MYLGNRYWHSDCIFYGCEKVIIIIIIIIIIINIIIIIITILLLLIIIIFIIIIVFWSKAATREGCSGLREWIPFIVEQFKGDQGGTTRQMLVSITLLLLIFAGLNDQEFRNLISNWKSQNKLTARKQGVFVR